MSADTIKRHATNALDAPTRIAHLIDGRLFGGAEMMVYRLVHAARATGIDARCWCLGEGRLAELLRDDGLPVRVLPSRHKFDPRLVPDLLAAVEQEGVRILHAHTSRTHLLARIVARRAGIRNVTTIQSPIRLDENRGHLTHPARAWIERAGRPWTDHIVTVSREERVRLIREEGAPPEKVSWIPNGARSVEGDPQAPDPRPLNELLARHGLARRPPFVVAMIAQLRPRKGPETLLSAFARFIARGGDGALAMIGDDSFTKGSNYLDTLLNRVREAGLGDRVIFTGFDAQPWRLAASADLIALPSLFGEGLPLVLVEALNHARPIAVSDTQGNRECVAGAEPGTALSNGWLHPPGDDMRLAEHLEQAAGEPTTREAMGRNGRALFERHYRLENVAEAYARLYRRLV